MTEVIAVVALALLFVVFGLFVRARQGCGGPSSCSKSDGHHGCGGQYRACGEEGRDR